MELSPRADAGNVLNFQYYYYLPSMAAAIIFVILFLGVTGFHFYKMFRTRTWFMIAFCIGGLFELVGYIGRAASAAQNPGPYTLGPYIIQSLLLLIAPALFAASIYMELARIVHMISGDHALFIRRTWLTKIFVFGDVFSFLLQSSGGGLLASGDASTIETGKKVVVAGLLAQIIFFGLFVLAAAIFHVRMRKAPTAESHAKPWTKHMLSLYGVSILIFIRSIVRVVEYIQGYDGYIMTHEAFIYVFDGVLMFAAMVVMAVVHPAEVAAAIREKEGKDGSGVELGQNEMERL